MMRFKEIFCWHRYRYKDAYYDIELIDNRFTLVLYERHTCVKCGKTKIKFIQSFEGLNIDELIKVRKLIQSHGALRRL